MGILYINTEEPGQIQFPNVRTVKIISSDNLATVTTAGYLNPASLQGYVIYNTDIINMWYGAVGQIGQAITSAGTFGQFTATIANGVITLVEEVNIGNVLLPVVANHIAIFNGTTGQITGNLSPAINGGNIQAGLSGTAGTLASFPATSAKGSLVIAAVANTGNTITTISNDAMGQASVMNIPDPGNAIGQFLVGATATPLVSGNLIKASGTAGLVVDAAFALHAGTTASYAGGGTSNAFTTTNMTASSIVTAVILTSTNSVSITKAVPGTNTLTVTFSADPGAATTVSWISVTPAG